MHIILTTDKRTSKKYIILFPLITSRTCMIKLLQMVFVQLMWFIVKCFNLNIHYFWVVYFNATLNVTHTKVTLAKLFL